MSKEQLEDLLLSNYKPRRPSKEAIKTHNEMMKKLLPLIKEVFPDMNIGKDNKLKKKEKTCHPKTQKPLRGFPHTNQNHHRKKQ